MNIKCYTASDFDYKYSKVQQKANELSNLIDEAYKKTKKSDNTRNTLARITLLHIRQYPLTITAYYVFSTFHKTIRHYICSQCEAH